METQYQEDNLYEIATTDAWKSLLRRLKTIENRYQAQLIIEAGKADMQPAAVARASGRLDAITAIIENLGGVARKAHGKDR